MEMKTRFTVTRCLFYLHIHISFIPFGSCEFITIERIHFDHFQLLKFSNMHKDVPFRRIKFASFLHSGEVGIHWSIVSATFKQYLFAFVF